MFQLTTQYKKGIIKLAVLLALLCFFIAVVKNYPVNEPKFVVNEELQCNIENKRLIDEDLERQRKFKWNVNKLTDFQGYQLGLNVEAIDLLFDYRKEGKFIYNLVQFQKVTSIRKSLLDSISDYLVFPKKKNNIIQKQIVNFKKKNLNRATSLELIKLGLPNKIAYRVINYRESIGGYRSMNDLKKVYDIESVHIDIIHKNYYLKK